MPDISVVAFPMHGYRKMRDEGFRTRDAHLVEWFAKLSADRGCVEVMSRPEPRVLRLVPGGAQREASAANILPRDVYTWALPRLADRRWWWVDSARRFGAPAAGPRVPAVIWNPFVAVSNIADVVFSGGRRTAADLLDDWTVHYAFASVKPQVEDAYRKLFDRVDSVTANSEGTVELARRFGRSDVQLVTNGVDPERFSVESRASGAFTVGYVGKIGRRVDLELVRAASQALPTVRFVMAGPILDKEYRSALKELSNVELVGDVHYDDMPRLLETFDVGWVPHRVGKYEVGGDVLKTYEYRAAGLPVLTTPVKGAGTRGLVGVEPLPAEAHIDRLRRFLAEDNGRPPRIAAPIPEEHTWRFKAEQMLRGLL